MVIENIREDLHLKNLSDKIDLKNYYISQLMIAWQYKTIPFKTFYNLKEWSMDELRLELRRYKDNPQVLPYNPKVLKKQTD